MKVLTSVMDAINIELRKCQIKDHIENKKRQCIILEANKKKK